MTSLFRIEGDLIALRQLIEEDMVTGEISPQLGLWLTDSEGLFDSKVESYCGVIGELEALAEARKVEAARIKALQVKTEARIRSMRDALKSSFQNLGVERLETTRYRVRLQRPGGLAPLILEDSEPIPSEFCRLVQQADKEKIRAALTAGEVLMFARLGERVKVLVIS